MKRLAPLSILVLFGLFLPLSLQAAGVQANPIPPDCQPYVDSGRYRVIYAQPGVTTNGGSGSQVIIGTTGDDAINAGSGNDVVCGGDGYDIIYGGSGNDIVFGNEVYDDIFGESGNDQLYGNDSTVFGVGDIVDGDSGNDNLNGGPGTDDVCIGDSGTNAFDPSCEIIE